MFTNIQLIHFESNLTALTLTFILKIAKLDLIAADGIRVSQTHIVYFIIIINNIGSD